jgi:hypothetical protein
MYMIERAIYSFWTKPMEDTYVGFNSEESLIECFALSLHHSKKWFKEVHLITDLKGKALIDKYGLEFDYVTTELEEALADIDKNNWALGKIYACKIQDKPFIHIDNDVILFKPLPQSFLRAEAGFQNPENHTWHRFYGDMIDFDKKNYKTPPIWYTFPSIEDGKSYNCGIIAFNRIEVVQEWWDEALKYAMYLDNIGGYTDVSMNIPSLIFEQHFVASLCKHIGVRVCFLTDFHSSDTYNETHIDDDLAEKLGYTHLISCTKREKSVEEKVKKAVKALGIKINYQLATELC